MVNKKNTMDYEYWCPLPTSVIHTSLFVDDGLNEVDSVNQVISLQGEV